MKNKKTEKMVLQKALEAFRKVTNLNIEIYAGANDFRYRQDAAIRIALGNQNFDFKVEVKKNLTKAMIGATTEQMRLLPEKRVIVTEYVTPQVADILMKMDAPFIDAAGNAYIKKKALFIFVKGNKHPQKNHKERPTRAFQPTGLQVVFTLLCDPGLAGAPYRKIAKKAEVALGTVGWVLNDLRELGFLIDMGKRGRRLTQKEELLRRWATAYPEQLRPKLREGTYRAHDEKWWKQATPPHLKAYWGGEIAAAKMTRYLKPETVTIYTRGINPIGKWLIKNRIKKDIEGNIEILNAFWNFENKWKQTDLVHPILIYADLLATGDTRNIETARIIYDQEITRLVRED